MAQPKKEVETEGEEVEQVESYNFMDLPFVMFSDFVIIVYAFAYKSPQYRSLFNDPVTFDINHKNTLNDMKEIIGNSYAENLLKVIKNLLFKIKYYLMSLKNLIY